MKKNMYAASLDTISRPQNKVGINKTDCYVGTAIARAIKGVERRKHERLVAAVSSLFGYHGSVYVDNVVTSLIKIFNLQKKENFNRFKKNIDDGYTAWFIYRFFHKLRCNESTIYPFEYGIYERDQTYGIQDFKKRFTPSAWKALVKIPVYTQIRLSRWYQSDQALEILAKCLHVGTDVRALDCLGYFIIKSVSMDLVEEILLFLKKCDKDENTLNTTAKDITDHIIMWNNIQYLKVKYPKIVKNLGIPLSGKWSLRRFTDEHSRLSQMKRDCDREEILEKEHRDKWKKKSFFNIHKFPQLKGSTIKVNGIELHVKLINNGVDLFEEGSKMCHCIFDYHNYMRSGGYFAFSITDSENPRNCCTIAFSVQSDYKTGFTIHGTPAPNSNYNEQTKKIIFDQVRGLRNHVSFTFNQHHLVDEMYDLMKATGFHDYITGLNKRPLVILKHHEHRMIRGLYERIMKRVTGKSNALFSGQMWGDDYPGFIYRPSTALDTEIHHQLLQAPPTNRDFENNFFYENDPIPRDNTRFMRSGLERFRETLNHGLNNVVTGFTQSIGSVMGQPNTISGYFGQAGNIIQHTISSHYPRPEVKEKPFLNSDFLKTVSNG